MPGWSNWATEQPHCKCQLQLFYILQINRASHLVWMKVHQTHISWEVLVTWQSRNTKGTGKWNREWFIIQPSKNHGEGIGVLGHRDGIPPHLAQKPFATLCTTQCWGMGAKETPAIRAELCNVTVRWIGNPWSWTHIIMRSAEPRRHQPHFPLFWETSGDSSLAEPSSSSCSSGSLYPHLCLTPSTVGCHSTGTSAPACPHNSWLCLQPDILRIFLSMFQH